MKSLKFRFLLSLLTIVIIITTSSCCFNTQANGQLPLRQVLSYIDNMGKSPQEVFLKSWNVIKNEYYDPTCNGQDWSRWKYRYLDKIKTKSDAYVAIDSMLESLNDPYTRFLSPYEFKEQDMNIDAKLFGIGVNIAQIKDRTIIIHVIDKTPAKKAGLQVGDIITRINNIPIKGYDIKKVAGMVRGKAGTTVKVTVLRNKKAVTKSILRKEINLKSVEYKVLDNKYAYIKISSFISQDTAKEVSEALKKTENTKGIILDIRGNYGGLLPNAIFISDMFIKRGIIVSIVDRNGYKDNIKASSVPEFTNKPMVVLINNSSASASEILSGALKDHGRAVLVGEKTFGKGLVQRIYELQDGSGINLTIAKYLTPDGIDINKKGIEPDYKVGFTQNDVRNNRDPQLMKAKQVLSDTINKYFSANK